MTSVLESIRSREQLCITRNGNSELMIELRDKLREWLEQQPHLPHDMAESRLEFFIICSKHSLEMAKQRIDLYYTMKKLAPEILANRDPLSKQLKQLGQFVQFVPLPRVTPENNRVVMFRYTSEDATGCEIAEAFKYTFMVAEVRAVEDTAEGDINIYDLSKMRLGHLTQLNPSVIKKSEVTATKVFGARIRGIHFINAPSFIDRIITLVKSMIKPKLAARVFVHSSGLESLYEVVPKSVLPVDYGGDEKSMDELDEKWHKKLEEWRDWFIEEDAKTVNEDLRPGPAVNEDDLFGLYGSFRKLQVD
ncbi:hypothetical protein QAD02_016846 [Eretmocerus hayati]|uniref:Uncharacterized protein n=1 Tax=Eretmocerus hayati TaxID=131215 RepID=A0ACC2PCP0_9HYME|nr:hypothetical protein QAD02_016846 [Eretmocerus hayati]